MAVAGIVLFLLVIAGLFALTFRLGRYGRGREREVSDVTRETALRDLSTPWHGGAGYMPSEGIPDRSPRDEPR
jgi:hypothetical protein